MLGPVKFEDDLGDRIKEPGVAIGLAWTEGSIYYLNKAGGKILYIEASKSKGSGKV